MTYYAIYDTILLTILFVWWSLLEGSEKWWREVKARWLIWPDWYCPWNHHSVFITFILVWSICCAYWLKWWGPLPFYSESLEILAILLDIFIHYLRLWLLSENTIVILFRYLNDDRRLCSEVTVLFTLIQSRYICCRYSDIVIDWYCILENAMTVLTYILHSCWKLFCSTVFCTFTWWPISKWWRWPHLWLRWWYVTVMTCWPNWLTFHWYFDYFTLILFIRSVLLCLSVLFQILNALFSHYFI